MYTNEIKSFVEKNRESMLVTLRELCAIPAPSHFEQARADYCKSWLEAAGAEGVYIDEAKNVIFPLNCEGSSSITVFAAHTDTVFHDTESMPYREDEEKIYCPGVADDTTSVVVLMTMAKYFIENKILPKHGIMFVCNSCEEGLGNLKGTRQLFSDYEGRIAGFISFDSILQKVSDRCVGSHRYRVEVQTEGGHSFGAFGNDNAIAKLSEIISEIYKLEVPKAEGKRTTYNVGEISGGTSVNTIAQKASMLCEYRSDDRECLDIMRTAFESIFSRARSEKVKVCVELVGERPCGNIEKEKVEELKRRMIPIIESVIGQEVIFASSSTDCNIPYSLGIPALCVGVNHHARVHTREEWMEKRSIVPGLEIAIRLGLEFTE